MKLERWIEHPFSDYETWLIDGWFLLTVSRSEVIQMVTGEYREYLVLKVAPAAFLSVPGHEVVERR